MTDDSITKDIDISELQSEFVSLKIGETIPSFEIARIRKVANSDRPDNLPGVEYKFFLDSSDGKVLKVNSWTLWREIRARLQEAGKIHVALSLTHRGVKDYVVKLV